MKRVVCLISLGLVAAGPQPSPTPPVEEVLGVGATVSGQWTVRGKLCIQAGFVAPEFLVIRDEQTGDLLMSLDGPVKSGVCVTAPDGHALSVKVSASND